MKRYAPFLSCLFLILTLACTVFLAVSCDDGDKKDAVTTEGTTEAPETEAPYVDARPIIDLPADAASLDALILSFDGATIENEEKLDRAYLGYCALSDEEREKVIYYDVLKNLRYELTKAYVVKEYIDSRMPHNELLIGAYVSNVTAANINTDAHLQDMANCYIDYAWHVSGLGGPRNAPVLDLYAKYGIGVFEWAGNLGIYTWKGESRLQGEAPTYPPLSLEQFEATLPSAEAADHKALWGFYMQDEPNAGDFDWMGAAGVMVQEKVLPNAAIMLNLHPNYATAHQLGRDSYQMYVRSFVGEVRSDFICYDHYMYSTPLERLEGFSRTLENYRIVADVCRQVDRDFYVILQNHTNDGERMESMTVDTMKFQAYSSMAYGAKSLIWACWIEGWGTKNILNSAGNKSEQYWELQEVNAELKRLEPVYMRYTGKSDGILIGADSTVDDYMKSFAKRHKVESMEQTSLTDFTCGDDDYVIVGAFDKNIGEGEAFMFAGCNDIYFEEDVVSTVTFRTADPAAVVTAYVKGVATVLEPDENGIYTVEIVNADGVFVTVD